MTTLQALSYQTGSSSSHSGGDHTLREQVRFMVNRAYQNIYGLSMPTDSAYQQPILDAALQLRRDPRSADMTEKSMLHACEDIIRISDEHHHQATKHRARASNPVYLRETALDNALEQQKYLVAINELMPQSQVSISGGQSAFSHGGRVQVARAEGALTSAEVMELAYQQLAFNIQDNR